MKILDTNSNNFNNEFNTLLARGAMDIKEAEKVVSNLLEEIKKDKNSAVRKHIEKFDKWIAKSDKELEISQDDMKRAYENKLLSSAKDEIVYFTNCTSEVADDLINSWEKEHYSLRSLSLEDE